MSDKCFGSNGLTFLLKICNSKIAYEDGLDSLDGECIKCWSHKDDADPPNRLNTIQLGHVNHFCHTILGNSYTKIIYKSLGPQEGKTWRGVLAKRL